MGADASLFTNDQPSFSSSLCSVILALLSVLNSVSSMDLVDTHKLKDKAKRLPEQKNVKQSK